MHEIIVYVADGGWSSWTPYGPCNKTCEQRRTRNCTDPPPSCGGKHCFGESDEKRSCGTGKCCPGKIIKPSYVFITMSL